LNSLFSYSKQSDSPSFLRGLFKIKFAKVILLIYLSTMPILNYTTKIDSYKTITEIQQILAKNKATKMIVDNDDKGNPVALTFCIDWRGMLNSVSATMQL
jgi:hypothetical protein